MIASMALRASLVAFGPIFAHAMKVMWSTRNHKDSMSGPPGAPSNPALALPTFQYFQLLGLLGAGRGGTAAGLWLSWGSVSVAMTTPTPRAGKTPPLAWIRAPRTSTGGGSRTLDNCTPAEVMPSLASLNRTACQPGGISMTHPA
jgi:hypothetical protein